MILGCLSGPDAILRVLIKGTYEGQKGMHEGDVISEAECCGRQEMPGLSTGWKGQG